MIRWIGIDVRLTKKIVGNNIEIIKDQTRHILSFKLEGSFNFIMVVIKSSEDFSL